MAVPASPLRTADLGLLLALLWLAAMSVRVAFGDAPIDDVSIAWFERAWALAAGGTPGGQPPFPAWFLAHAAEWSGGRIHPATLVTTAAWLVPAVGAVAAPAAFLAARTTASRVWAAMAGSIIVFALPLVADALPGRPGPAAFEATLMLSIAAAMAAGVRKLGMTAVLLGGLAIAAAAATNPTVLVVAIGPWLIASTTGPSRVARATVRVLAAGCAFFIGLLALPWIASTSWAASTGTHVGLGLAWTTALMGLLVLRLDRHAPAPAESAARGWAAELSTDDAATRIALTLTGLFGWVVSPACGVAGTAVAAAAWLARIAPRLPGRGRNILGILAGLVLAAVATSTLLTFAPS